MIDSIIGRFIDNLIELGTAIGATIALNYFMELDLSLYQLIVLFLLIDIAINTSYIKDKK